MPSVTPALERELNRARIKERLWLLGRLAARAWLSLRRFLSAPFHALAMMNVAGPERLLIAPQDIRTADPVIAADIYAGYFAFGGKIINTQGHLPFEIGPQEPEWERALYGFGWLRHLRSAESALATANARVLVEDFLIHVNASADSCAFEPAVVARRLLSFLSQSPMLLEGADHAFYRRLMRHLMQAQRFLARQLALGLAGETRLLAAIALAEFSLCAQDGPGFRRTTRLLGEELERQILPDGGHISRNPDALVRLLLDLLPLRQVYAMQAVPPPPQLLNAIDRMLPMLRLLRHGDGTLALFNGMGVTAPDVLATVLAYDDASSQPLINAPYSGYQRVEAGDSALIIDAGRPPPATFSRSAHAGCLSFELSVGAQRLVINCGAPNPLHSAARAAARTTAAHSTVIIADTSSCRFAGQGGLESWFEGEILAGPRRILAERQQSQKRVRLRLSHDGYAARFGLTHERRLTLAADGLRLDGEDRLRPALRGGAPRAQPFALRFHIHPSVRLQSVPDGRAVLLTLPNGSRWIFDTPDAPVSVEESIFFAAAEGPRACEQIVVAGDSEQYPQISWTLRYVDQADARPSEFEPPPELQ